MKVSRREELRNRKVRLPFPFLQFLLRWFEVSSIPVVVDLDNFGMSAIYTSGSTTIAGGRGSTSGYREAGSTSEKFQAIRVEDDAAFGLETFSYYPSQGYSSKARLSTIVN